MKRLVVTGVVLSLMGFASWPDHAAAGEPQEKIRQTINEVIDILSDEALKAPQQTEERRAKMRQAVTRYFGFTEMAQRAMGQHWRKLTTAQRKEFVPLFSDLLERSYVSKIEGADATKDSIQYVKESIDEDGYATVVTEIVNPRDQNFEVAYRLLKRDEDWQVYDVSIEGVSLVNNYRTQFNKIIRQSSYESLVKQMKVKLEQEKALDGVKG
ncbi:MlaC/ttg2D family ABC transporter substrate-binding protein [Candidatus Entotheonella palauensis]|nr:ABC transporter substrate-binding protein [Candidatus Entotheonella palauensis]